MKPLCLLNIKDNVKEADITRLSVSGALALGGPDLGIHLLMLSLIAHGFWGRREDATGMCDDGDTSEQKD